MKKLGKSIGKAFVFCAVMMLLCSFAYPLALTGISQVAMKEKANGNLIDKNGNSTADPEEAVGSALVGQDFTEDYFFKAGFLRSIIILIPKIRKKTGNMRAYHPEVITTATRIRN